MPDRMWLWIKKFYKRHKRALQVTTLLAVVPLYFHWQANQIAGKSYELSITPRLSVATNFRTSHVGASGGQDEVICVPVAIFNNSSAYALDVEFDVLMSRAKGEEVSLNQYLRSKNQLPPYRSRLAPGAEWQSRTNEFCISVVNNAIETYKSGKEQCKVQINLAWRDIQRKQHRLVHLAQLVYAAPSDRSGGYFWFERVGSYETLAGILGWWQVHRHWGLPSFIIWSRRRL